MKKIILLCVLITIANCTLKNIEKTHGVASLESKFEKLIENKTNKNQILEDLGPPSTKNIFDNSVWIYLGKKTRKKNLFKLARNEDVRNDVVVLEINSRGILVKKKLYTIENIQNIKFSEKITTKTEKDSFVFGVLSSFRQKIDSPKRNKKVSQQ